MKAFRCSTFLLFIASTMIASIHTEETKYDLSDKNQFSFYFHEQWQTMFNTPQPIANPARDNIVSLLANELYFQPCYTVERTNGYRYFKDRLWGMMHVLKKCQVRSSVVLPSDPYNNKNNAMLEMEFIQNSTFTSYTKHFHDISMEMKAKKAEVNEPYRIYRITEVCSDQ